MIFWQALGESEEGGVLIHCKKLNGVAFDSNTFFLVFSGQLTTVRRHVHLLWCCFVSLSYSLFTFCKRYLCSWRQVHLCW